MIQDLNNSDKRLTILTFSEKKLIYNLPKFTQQERKLYFDLEKIEENIIYNQLNGENSKIYFILQLGYFKACYRFFKFTFDEVLEDIKYIVEKYFPDYSISTVKRGCNRKTIFNHHSIILKLFFYRFPTKEDNITIFNKAKSIVPIDTNPKYIFKEIVRFVSNNKIILPAYSTMQKIISKAIILSEKELFSNLKIMIDDDLAKNINDLLVKESAYRYQLTIIKAPPKNFSNKQAINERRKQEKLKPIFDKAKVIFAKLKISNLSIKYFAYVVDRCTIQNLCRFDDMKKYFYVLCFVYYRYIKINDDLISTFLYHVNKHKNEIKNIIEEKILEIKIENSCNLTKGASILRLFTDNFDSTKSADELRTKAFNILSSNKIK